MFNNGKIAAVWGAIDSLPSREDVKPLAIDAVPIPCKIISCTFNATDKVYDYAWQGIKDDGSDDSMLGSGSGARCIQEFGSDLTGKPSYATVDDIVQMQRTVDGCRFITTSIIGLQTPLLDLSLEANDNIDWDLSDNTAVKMLITSRQWYDHANLINREYKRYLWIDSKGIIFKISTVDVVDGFETEIHSYVIT